MNFTYINSVTRSNKLTAIVWFLLACSFTTGIFIPSADAVEAPCPSAVVSPIGTELVQLLGCTFDFSNNNNDDSSTFTAPAGLSVGDLLMVHISVDSNGEALNPPAGWTEVAPDLSGRDISSNVWTRVVTDLAVDIPGVTTYTFTWADEKNYGYLLHFSGASGLFNFAAISQGNSTNPTSPAIVPNSLDNLILRMGTIDRGEYVQDGSQGFANYSDLIQRNNTGNGAGTRIGVTASYGHVNLGASVGGLNFSLSGGNQDGSHNRTFAIEPYEFRFSTESGAAGTSSVCGIEQITLSVTDRNGGLMTWFDGTVTLSTTNNTGALWSYAGAGLTPGVDGNATYTFQPGDGGTVTLNYYNPNPGLVDFEVSFGDFSESTNPSYTEASLNILDCEFVMTNEAGNQVETCAQEVVTISLQDTAGNPANNYSGTLTIDNGSGGLFGNFELDSGSFVLSNNPDQGLATYPFAITPTTPGTPHQLVLNYIHGSTDTTTVNIALTEDSGLNIPEAGANASLTVAACELLVTLPDGDTTRDVCTMTRVRFEVSAGGSPVTNFSGVINLTTSAGQGLWLENALETYPGVLSGGGVGDGTASYDFNGTENGVVIFDFRNQVTATNLSFGATGLSDGGIALAQGGSIPVITDIAQCTLTITTASVSNIADACRGGESVTYKVTDRDGADAIDYNGTVIIQTSSSAGNYALTAGSGSLTGAGGNDGFASYEFHADDDGEFTVDYSVLAVPLGDTATLTATISNVTLVNTDGTLTFRDCEFRISYPSDTAPFETDVCSVKQVQIEIVDGAGVPAVVDDYTGTINITTSTGFGSWSENPADNDGTLTDPFGEDGAASYTFVDADDGVVLLDFTHTAGAAASLNINVTDTITSDPGNPGSTFDPNLLVELCTFQISYDGGVGHDDISLTACEVQVVTIEVYDSQGALAVDYAGQINISTSTNNGNWSIDTGEGALSNVVVDGGAVSYTFNDDGIGLDDNGTVDLAFSNLNSETVNIDIVDEVIALSLDGVMVEEGAADPNMEIGSCIPTVQSHTCAIGGTGIATSLTIDPQATDPGLRGRMVIILTSHEGDADVTNVTFGGIAASKLLDIRADEGAFDNNTEVWAINDATMPNPGTPTSYDAVVTHGDDDLGVCALYATEVDQTFPTTVAPPDEDTGQINATFSTDDQPIASTTITTTENNALIVSAVGHGSTGTYSSVSPSPPMARLFNETPSSAVFAGSVGNASNAAAITIDETATDATTLRHTHIVAAFNPLISGPPVAESYEPVVLFQTYSGNMSYRAIGASFQDAPNAGGVCSLVNPLEATANLQLPDVADGILAGNGAPFSGVGEFDSDVEAAWLYWFASGSYDLPNMDGFGAFPNTQIPANFDNVTFSAPNGLGGFSVTNITADDVFVIENVGSDNNADFYVGYKDVTGLLVGRDNELIGSDENPNGDYTISNMVIDDNQPWLGRGSCAGGFALVVVYGNEYEQLRVLNLFHGFQPFQNSSFTLVPRNFRIAARDTVTNTPNGQVTHITVEGDAGNSGVNEALTIQDDPTDFDPGTFNPLFTDFNPAEEEFNGTVTRPVYALTDVVPGGTGEPAEYKYIFDDSSAGNGNPSNGYEIDFPNPAVFPFTPPGASETVYGLSYGVDVDTHFIDGDEIGDILYNFADPSNLAEEITTRYAADGDLVLLVAEIISVNNAPIADIEITISEADASYKVGSTGVYDIEVKNNGNGAITFGTATGFIEVVGELPAGMTFASGGNEITGTGWTCTDSVDSSTAFTCTHDIPASPGLGDASLPTLSATVTIAQPPAFFPSLNNDAKLIVRVQHSDGTCLGGSTGILPTPTSSCEPPEFDNVNDLAGGALDINDIDDKTGANNNVHSITTNVQGIETDLSVVKAVTTILEEGSSDGVLYTITVTNNGPDDIVGTLTQPAITITDNEPVGVNFDSASGTDWSCVVNAGAPDQLVCTFDNNISGIPIASGASSVITVVGDVTGSSPTPVTNTVQVTSGTYNFDNVPGNNTSGTTDNISPVPAAVTDRFLLSVSAAAAMNTTSLGSGGGLLSDFSDDDVVLYDPVTDSAELFIDSATTPSYSVTDPNAIHLLPNGQVVMSANADGNSIGTNNQAFDKDDIVVYDKLLNTATLLFDGSAHITDDGGDSIDLNIDSVYVLYDGRIIFSTEGPASDGGGVSWSDSDLVLYDPVGDTFSIYLDAEDDNVFDAVDAQVDALYLRVDPADATMVLDTFVVSSEVQGAVLGDNNVVVGRDDVAEITVDSGGTPSPTGTTSTNLFNGGIPIGVFDTMEPDLKLNALHLIEPAHLGHYEISEVDPGTACAPAKIRIRKHLGTSHTLDTATTGSIVISTDSMPENGVWVLDTGEGTLDNSYGGSSDNGQALYTFFDDGAGGLADDDGEVILTLDVSESPPVIDSVNVSVTNGFVVDGDTADNPFEFNLVTTDVDYRDNFTVAAFNNNDGSAGWSGNWTEVDAFDGVSGASGAGMGTGNIQMTGGKLTLTSNTNTEAGSIDPSMARAAGLGFFAYTEPVLIKFDYGYQSVTNLGDEIELQISNDGVSYITVQTYDSLDGSSVSDIDETVDVSANIISAGVPGPTEVLIDGTNPNLYVRFVVTEGYVLGTFTVDNLQVTTSTTACDTASLAHYHVSIPDPGLACITSNVTITGHDFGHNSVPIPAGTLLTLSTSTGAGSWVDAAGGGTLIDTGTITDGQATYELTGGDEEPVQLMFNYTDPAGDGAVVNINVNDGSRTEVQDGAHDPSPTFNEAGLVFFDQDAGNLSTALPFQIAGKYSLTAPASGDVTLQIVRSVDIAGNEAAACESLVSHGDIVTVTMAGLCVDPMGCDVGADTITIFDSGGIERSVPVFSSPTANPEQQGSATDLTLEFLDRGAEIEGQENIGAEINFMYPNSGTISLHAEYEIPLNNDIAGTLSGDTINGASETFIVRPFAFDIDFDVAGDDRSSNGPAPFAGAISYATDASGPAFARAGVGFDATVSAVLWEQDDDADMDGIADPDADLSNNPVATNFGDEAVDNNTVIVSVRTDNPGVPGGVNGAMVTVDGSSDVFQGFSAGVSGPQNIAIDEVGIFDLSAVLVDNNMDRNPINYYESTPYTAVEGVVGGVTNVGRIYPNHFELQPMPTLGPRVNQMCSPDSTFTYMGEDFGIGFELQAKNFQNTTTQNYFGTFAKLTLFDEYNMSAVIDLNGEPDNDVTSRLVNSTIGAPSWAAGSLTVNGDMNIARLVTGEDAPLENVQISINPIDANDDGVYDGGMGVGADNDVLLNILDVDVDDGVTEPGDFLFRSLATHDFRYGRMLVENTYGSEFEDLEIGIAIEYFDGNDFVVNIDDSCTAIAHTAADDHLDFVPGSYEDFGGGDIFEAGDTLIENDGDATITVFQGQTLRLADGNSDSSDDTDRPFFTTAPPNEETGRVLVELDLTQSGLDFLKYDWRGGAGEDPGDPFDEEPEGANYDDDPRGIVEFGSYRGHDRVINWQEIYIGP